MLKQRYSQLSLATYLVLIFLSVCFLPSSVLSASSSMFGNTYTLHTKFSSIIRVDTTPLLFTPCYVFGRSSGSNVDALVSFPLLHSVLPYADGLPNDSIKHMATFGQIGATYGLAYSQVTKLLYASAFIKRHTGLGPNGTGAIYKIDPLGIKSPSLFVDLNAIFGGNTAGVNPHPYTATDVCPDAGGGSTNFACWFNDVNTWNAVGRQGLGDLDISEDGQFLYVMNMTNKTLYKIPITNPNSSNITTYPFPTNLPGATLVCSANSVNQAIQIRPMGLGVKNGKIYAGAVCTQEADSPLGGVYGGDKIYVYELTPSTGIWQLVLEGSIQNNFLKPFIWPANYTGTYADNRNLILSDIDFDNAGGMFIGMRDIAADRYGNNAGKPIVGDGTIISYIARGDILKACYDAGSGKYILESNGSCGGVTTAGPATGEGIPYTNATAKEYFFGDNISTNDAGAREISLGGVAYSSATDEVLVTAFDPITVYQQGLIGLNNQTGARSYSGVIVESSSPTGQFGKVNGLGDLELVSSLVIPCVVPTITNATADTATCTSGAVNNNAAIHITGIVNGVKYSYGTNGTAGLFAANATTLSGGTIDLVGLPNPSVSKTYTIRIYGVDSTCYNDTTVTVYAAQIPNLPSIISSKTNGCPATSVDLTTLSATLPPSVSGGIFEWHVSNSSSSALVSDPSSVGAGVYYLFEKSPVGCSSTGAAVQVQIDVCCPPQSCLLLNVSRGH